MIQQILLDSVIVAEGPGSSSETRPSVIEGDCPSPAGEPCRAQLVLALALST